LSLFRNIQVAMRNSDEIPDDAKAPAEWQRIGNQIDAAFIVARADFVNVCRTLRVAGACEFKYLVALSG